MTSVADSLKQLRERAGLSIRAIARELGYKSQASYQYYESAENHPDGLPAEFVQKLARVLTGMGEPPITSEELVALARASSPVYSLPRAASISGDEILTVPIYDIRASAGSGSLGDDGEPIGYQPFREQMLSRISHTAVQKLAVIMVAGDSMEPTLANQDQVLVDLTARRIARDGLYILALDDALLVKRCQVDLQSGEIIVKSDNPAYDTIRVSDRDRLKVIGRVIWIGRVLG